MPNYFPIRNAMKPTGESFGWDETEPKKKGEIEQEIAGWLSTAATETPKDKAGTDAAWFEDIMKDRDLTNLSALDLTTLAQALKDKFVEKMSDYDNPMLDPLGHYIQVFAEVKDAEDPKEIIALICSAVLMTKNPDRLTEIAIPKEDAALFADIRQGVIERKKSHQEREQYWS